MKAQYFLSLTAGTLLLGCNWNRFSEFEKNAPIEELTAPSGTEDFGQSVAAARAGDRAQVLALGTKGPGASYNVGISGSPELDPDRASHCAHYPPTSLCTPAVTPVGLPLAWTSSKSRQLCLMSGAGRHNGQEGLVGICADGTAITYPMPSDVQTAFIDALENDTTPPLLHLAADRSDAPYFIAGASEIGRAFFYLPESGDALDLATPSPAPAGFGKSVAVLRGASATLFAVGAPDSKQVWLYRESAGVSESLGCVGDGTNGFGRTLASGDLNGDGLDDLVVAGAAEVFALDGATIAALPVTTSSTCTAELLSEPGLLSRFACKSGSSTTDCKSSDFGKALSVFDGAGDGILSIAVGAPKLTVDGVREVGAVLVFTPKGELIDTSLVSTAVAGAHFGTSITRVAQEDRDVLAIGAPGQGLVALSYCAAVTGSGVGLRCDSRASQ